MLFFVKTELEHLPPLSKDEALALMRDQWEYIIGLKKNGKLTHAYRMSGQKGGVAIASVASAEELDKLVSDMPLFPFLKIEIAALREMESLVKKPEAQKAVASRAM